MLICRIFTFDLHVCIGDTLYVLLVVSEIFFTDSRYPVTVHFVNDILSTLSNLQLISFATYGKRTLEH